MSVLSLKYLGLALALATAATWQECHGAEDSEAKTDEACEAVPTMPTAGVDAFEVRRVKLGRKPKVAQQLFREYFKSRTPVIMTDQISKATMKKWKLRSQKKAFGTEGVVVTVQPNKWVDDRESNFHAVHNYVTSDIDVMIQWGAYLDLLDSKPPEGVTKKTAKRVMGTESWRAKGKEGIMINWRTAEVYLRTTIPSDHRGDNLGPKLFQVHTVPDLIVDELAADGLPLPDTNMSKIVRGGSAGTYYPAHFDCFPNLLQNFVGSKDLLIFDQVAAWRDEPRSYQRLLKLKNITAAANEPGGGEWPELQGRLWHATLNPGETLFIPVLMLHEVQTAWGGGSLGVNTFFEQFDFPDSKACTQIKLRHPMTWDAKKLINFIREQGSPIADELQRPLPPTKSTDASA